MPLHTIAKPIIGVHYFGDFQLPFGYATNLRHSISPYLGPSLPTSYPPVAEVFFALFSFLPLDISVLIFLSLSVVVFLVPLWLMLAPLRSEYRIIFLTLVAVLTTPFIDFLDRGNDIGIAVGLIAWAIWAWKSERWVLCGIFFVAAIALKAYPAALLVIPLGLRRYRFTAIVAVSAAAASLIPLLFFPKGILRNIHAVLSAVTSLRFFPSVRLLSWSLYSVIPNTAGFIFGPTAAGRLLAPNHILIWLPSILYLCGVYFVIRRGRVPQWCWGPLSLASIQLLVPVSFSYTTAWAPIAAVWYAWGNFVDVRAGGSAEGHGTGWVVLRIMVLLDLVVTLAPSVFVISGSGNFQVPLGRYLSPLLLLVTLCIAISYSMRPIALESSELSVS